MHTTSLYSLILELQADKDAVLPATLGQKTHALFLSLIAQVNPTLADRLHNEPSYRPFTVSSLLGVPVNGHEILLKKGQTCAIRITLLDGGELWQCLSQFFLEKQTCTLHLGETPFLPRRILSQPQSDHTGWAAYTTWQTLASTQAQPLITFHFHSPTTFSLGNRQFALYPEPILVWDSLLRSWNLYTPDILKLEKIAIREFVNANVKVNDYQLKTTMLHYPKHMQKGFTGTCTYQINSTDTYASHISALAAFAPYCGIGYKTTMGMGQVQVSFRQKGTPPNTSARGSAPTRCATR